MEHLDCDSGEASDKTQEGAMEDHGSAVNIAI